MKILVSIILLSLNSLLILGQDQKIEPFIEVNGKAIKKVAPDRIYIDFELVERMDGKVKVTIEELENELKNTFVAAGIDVSNLFLSDANSNYVKVKWIKKDVLVNKEYTIMVKNATELGKVFQEFEKLKIEYAYVSKVEHSQIGEFKKETRINAMKNAREKADYLLNAIGDSTGMSINVVEETHVQKDLPREQSPSYKSFSSDDAGYNYNGQIEFKKIEITTNVYVKFLIK